MQKYLYVMATIGYAICLTTDISKNVTDTELETREFWCAADSFV